MRRIFISHRRIKGKVSSTARMIANLLRKSYYNKVFLDVDENYATQFPNKLQEEIQKCDICVLVLPDDGDLSFLYNENNWVRKEIESAMKYEKPIVPIITKQDFQWPTDLPETVKGLSHNKEGIYGGLNISYYDTNHEKESIRSIRKIINSIKPQNVLNLIFGHTPLILILVCILLLGIGYWGYYAFYPYTENQASELFNKAGRQNAKGYIEKAAENYKKIADFLKEKQIFNTDYFVSKFMYAELTRDRIPSDASIVLFRELTDETQNYRSSATIWEVNRKAMFMLGRIYNQSGNMDSCTYYFNEVKPYFEEKKDWHITEINYVLNGYKDIGATTESQTKETTTESKVQEEQVRPQIQETTKSSQTKDAATPVNPVKAQENTTTSQLQTTTTISQAEKTNTVSPVANIQDKDALYHEGMYAYEKQNFVLAFQYFLKAAKQGQLEAQAMVGICYARGEGVELDYVEADKWFQTAAKFGNSNAQYNLGISYYNNKKYKEAVEWFLKAAHNSTPNRLAMEMLSTCYANGWGVEKDSVIAYEWFKKSQKFKN